MVDWRVARSLDVLLDQINEAAPARSKASDGSIGDLAHQNTRSDHNPDAQGVVRARDFTHDPADGADMHRIAEALRVSRDSRIKYVIWNERIFSGAAGPSPWVWRAYSGDNPHDHHMHVSVVATAAADDTRPWQIGVEPEMELTDVVWVAPAGPRTVDAILEAADTRSAATLTTVNAILTKVNALAGADPVNEDEIVAGVLAGLGTKPVPDIAAALRAALTPTQIAELAAALTGG